MKLSKLMDVYRDARRSSPARSSPLLLSPESSTALLFQLSSFSQDSSYCLISGASRSPPPSASVFRHIAMVD